eukprot:1226323-Alexandrium_andersonii.AAC.1
MSALSGPGRHPKGRKKGATSGEIAKRGRFCSFPHSSVRAHAGASQGQQKVHMNTEVFAKSSPSSSRIESLERRCTASCNRSGTRWAEPRRAFPSKHG